MAIVDSIKEWRDETGYSQRQLSKDLHVDGSYISKIEKGDRAWPEHLDSPLSKRDWRLAMAVIDERSGGYIQNRYGTLDTHPSALKETLLKDLEEAMTALRGIMLANRDPEKQREQAKKVRKEIKDVLEVGAIMYGVIGDTFELDKPSKGGK